MRPTRSPFHRPAMQTLERLHAELGGQILENKEEAQRLAGQMLHVEAVIKMLDPTYNLRRISVKRRQAKPKRHSRLSAGQIPTALRFARPADR